MRHHSYISMPAVLIQSNSAPFAAEKLLPPALKHAHHHSGKPWSRARTLSNAGFWFSFMLACLFFSALKFPFLWHPQFSDFDANLEAIRPLVSPRMDLVYPLPPHPLPSNMSISERQFWTQPENQGYKPCLNFGKSYRQESVKIASQKQKFMLVIVSGGLNQQRNQIVDAVVIARILEAALVVPILQVNYVWGDESEFSDIFDVEHFKKTLKDDVRIVSSLPSTHIMTRPVEEKKTPLNASPQWFRTRYLKRLNREGVLLLRGLDSRLSKDLPSDLQKLRCKVAFHALRFAQPILDLGNKLAKRMWDKGPYVALHLRLEKDVWVRTGCLPGLGKDYDEEVHRERIMKPRLLTARSNLTYEERKQEGLCPLNAAEVARLLKGLGASSETRIFWAGGEPLGGHVALEPLIAEFPHLYNKNSLVVPGELEPYTEKASTLAAIDYIISLNSDVFMPSHGGNMGRALQGHRAYEGHRKYITPNKRELLPLFSNETLSMEQLDTIIRDIHSESLGQPSLRTDKKGRDVVAFPVPDCMCNK